MALLKWLSNVSPFRGMPVDDTGSSSSVTSQSGETIQMYYNSSGTLTSDAGQAAGTVVMAKTTYNNILNNLGDSIAKKGDKSLSFTSTALTTEVGIGTVDPQFVESLDEASWSVRMASIGAKLAQGEYYVDYPKGVIYGKKASTQSTLTSGAYKYHANAGSSGTGASASQVQGTAAAGAAPVGNPLQLGAQYLATPGTATDTFMYPVQVDSAKNLRIAEQFAPNYEDQTNNVAAILPKAVAASTYAPSRFQNLGANATLNIKATTGNILSVYCHNVSGGDRWLQLHNTASTPSGGATPVFSFYVPAGGVTERGTEFFTQAGVNGSNGWAFAISTTEGTYTAATATDHFTYINYI